MADSSGCCIVAGLPLAPLLLKEDSCVKISSRPLLLSNLYSTSMLATKRLAVTEPVWAELSDLKRPGETFNQLLAGMIEGEKKVRLIEHLKEIADEGDFVELPP